MNETGGKHLSLKRIVSHPLFKGDPNFEIFKEGAEKNLGLGEDLLKERGTKLFKSNVGIDKDKNEDSERQMRMNSFCGIPAWKNCIEIGGTKRGKQYMSSILWK